MPLHISFCAKLPRYWNKLNAKRAEFDQRENSALLLETVLYGEISSLSLQKRAYILPVQYDIVRNLIPQIGSLHSPSKRYFRLRFATPYSLLPTLNSLLFTYSPRYDAGRGRMCRIPPTSIPSGKPSLVPHESVG